MNKYMAEGRTFAPPTKQLAGDFNASTSVSITELSAGISDSYNGSSSGGLMNVSSIVSNGALLNIYNQPFISSA